MAFRPGEVVSQRVVGGFLAGLFDALLTVDPHLHRVATLSEAVPLREPGAAVVLSGAPLLAELIARHHTAPLLLGPDEESLQWVASAAATHGWEHAVCHKQRQGDRQVRIVLPTLPGTPLVGRAVVLLDDVASSGHTLAQATRLLLAAGAATVDVAVTHALFAGDAVDTVKAAGVRHVWSTDCISHPSNAVSIVPAVAEVLRGWLGH
jgi:ribose-phosphate pyrophosphokinase